MIERRDQASPGLGGHISSTRAVPQRASIQAEYRRPARSGHLALGTLACPACDAPVLPAAGPAAPTDKISCPVCAYAGQVRGFLSLETPVRPARVVVRVSGPSPRRAAAA